MEFSLVLEPSSCLLGLPFGSRAFLAMRRMVPCMILGEVASRCLYFVDKPSHVGRGGVDVDGLAYPPHRPTVHRHQKGRHGLSTGHCTYYQMHVAPYCYVPLCQGPEAATSQGPEWAMLIRCRKPPDTLDRGLGSLPRVNERGERGKQMVKSHLLTLIIGWRIYGVDHF
jgi:hypothetical protein